MSHVTRVKRWRAWWLFAGLLLVFFAGRASAVPRPNLESALGHLEQAKRALTQADRDRAGLRDKASGLVDQAIGTVRQAILAAK